MFKLSKQPEDGVTDESNRDEGDNTFHKELNDSDFPKKFRTIRTNSYHQAISSPPKGLLPGRLPNVSEQSEQETSSAIPEILYQEVKERGISTVDDDDERLTYCAGTTRSLQRRGANRVRMTWSGQSHVRDSGTLVNMNAKQRKRQDSMFELITSEFTYLRSLNILVSYFMSSNELRSCLTNTQFHHLFSNVEAVRIACRRFYSALEKRRKASSVVISDVCDIVLEHVTSGYFEPYVTYCSNETYQQRALQKLMRENPQFVKELQKLESGKECAGLPLHSFLLLPMQRITRLPLLVDTILQRCEITMPQYETASRALREITNLVKVCNERARSMERTEQMIQLQQQLDFKSSRSFALISSSRFLIKSGSLTRIVEESVFGFRRFTKQEVHLFLFNDALLVAKRKSDEGYIVTDYCYKNRLRCRDVINDIVGFILIMEQNQDGQQMEMRFEADKPNTKSRWMAAFMDSQMSIQITTSNVQVEVVQSFRTDETDMVSLKVMDVYIVLKTTPDGFYYGERISDGCRGWFPSEYVEEIFSLTTREKNLQRRCRLLGEQTTI